MQSDPEFGDLLPELQKFFARPSLQLVLRKEWGASNAGNRARIRAFIHDNIHAAAEVLDLAAIPGIPGGHLSISHSKALGGVFWALGLNVLSWGIGFDIELVERCKREMMKRVSTEQEMDAAPSMAALWTAKEAAFKAIPRGGQPYSVSQIKIGGWEKSPVRILGSGKY